MTKGSKNRSSEDIRLSKKFRSYIELSGRKYSWFIDNYCPRYSYSAFMNYLGRNKRIPNEAKKAMKKFIKDNE